MPLCILLFLVGYKPAHFVYITSLWLTIHHNPVDNTPKISWQLSH